MQKAKAKSLLYEKQRKCRSRSILASIAPVPFQSVLVLSHAWTQWKFANLTVEKTSRTFIPHPVYISERPAALENVADVCFLRLLWLGVAKGQATIEVEGLSVFISSFSLFYGISMPKEKLLSILISANEEHEADFTFVEALSYLPPLIFVPPSQAITAQALDCLKLCYVKFTWKDLFRACCAVYGSVTLPLLHIVLVTLGKSENDEVTDADFYVFVNRLYEKPDKESVVLNALTLMKPSVARTKEDSEPHTACLSLLNFLVMMDREHLTEYIR